MAAISSLGSAKSGAAGASLRGDVDAPRVGVDLGGTKTEAVVVRVGGPERGAPEVLARRRVPTASRALEDDARYAQILEDTRALVASVVEEAGLTTTPPVGVSMPGSATRRLANGEPAPSPRVKNANTTCLNGRPFYDDLRAALGVPTWFANDANCFALAEHTWGAARGARVTFGVILGTGVGGGVVFDGRVWDGAQGVAGEWGHVVLEPDAGPSCYCGRRGCVETYLSGPAIEAAYAARSGTPRRLPEIVERAAGGDAIASALLDERYDLFGRAMSTVVDVLDPDVIVIGGGVSNLEALYTKGAEALGRWAFTDHLTTRIAKNELGDSAGVLGAALLPSAAPT